MASQKQLKQILKKLMNEHDNALCVDCCDKRPTWASILVPPPGASFAEPIGCFMCYHCSGAHRRMGTHICFVRSTNLDEWKEKEISAMKRGGNKVVNAMFEATLTDRTMKPDKHTDLEPRSEFIYQKYQHRKWYDASRTTSNGGGNSPPNVAGPDPFANHDCAFGGDAFANVASQEFKVGTSQEFEIGSQEFRQEFGSFGNLDAFGGSSHNDYARAEAFAPRSPGVFGDFTARARISLISNLESKEFHANVLHDIAHMDIGDDPLSPVPKPKRVSMSQKLVKRASSRSKPKKRLSEECEL